MESLIILVSGSGVGFIAGLFGVGGSFLLVPLLSITTSLPIEVLVGSSACHVLGPATATGITYHIPRRDLRIPMILLGGILVGTVAGSDLLSYLHAQSEAYSTFVIQLCYVAFFWVLGGFSWWETVRRQQGRPIPIGWLIFSRLRPVCRVRGRHRELDVSVISLSLFGSLVGFLSGLLGLGGGVLLLPGLHYAYGIPTKRTLKMSVLLVWLIAFQATIVHAMNQRVDLWIVVLLLVGATTGAKSGAKLGSRLSGPVLRQYFALMLLISALLMSAHFAGWF